MNRQITLEVPETVYQQAEQLAAQRELAVSDLLVETIVQSFPALRSVDRRRTEMLREEAVYARLHPWLMENYAGQHVAITGGELVDSDVDGVALLRRVRENYPGRVVLRRQVDAQPMPEMRGFYSFSLQVCRAV